MNKTKKVAWHKHLKKARKLKEKKVQEQKAAGTSPIVASTARR